MPDPSAITAALTAWTRWDYGIAGRLNDYWTAEIEKDPQLKNLIMTVDLLFGSDRHVRTASQALTSTSGKDDAIYRYDGALGADYEVDHTMSLGEPSSSARSISVSIPADLLDPAELVAQGRHLAGYGEVSLQVDGGDWDQRLVILRGDMDDGVSFGAPGESLDVSVTDPKESADLNFPPWLIDDNTWPNHHADAAGYRYPVVMNEYVEVPALPVNTGSAQWLVCWGHGWTIDIVQVDGENYGSGDAVYGWSQTETVDGRGVSVTLIEFTGTYVFDWTESVNVSVSGAPRGMDTLIDQIEMIASRFTTLGTAGIARDLFSVAEARLGPLKAAVLANASSADSAVRALEFIEGSLLSSFPMVSMVWDRGGYGPVVTDRDDQRKVADLEVGVFPLIDRYSSVQETPKNQIFNSFGLRYDFQPTSNDYQGIVTRDGSTSDLCAMSVQVLGERHADPIDAPFITDSSVAEYVIDWLVRHKTLPSYYVEYEAYPWIFFYLRRGDNLSITDSDFGWTQEDATVERMLYRRGRCIVGFRVWQTYFKIGGASSAGSAASGGD